MRRNITSEYIGEHDPGRLWVRVRGKKMEDLIAAASACGAEMIRSSLRRIDAGNVMIDMLVSKEMAERLKKEFPVRVLGNIDTQARSAAGFVSPIDRYRK